jgi:hypothetical protein
MTDSNPTAPLPQLTIPAKYTVPDDPMDLLQCESCQ